MTWLPLLLDGLVLGSVVVCFVVLYVLIAERQDRRRARYLLRQDRPEPRAEALVACSACGCETRVLNGKYIVACGCEAGR